LTNDRISHPELKSVEAAEESKRQGATLYVTCFNLRKNRTRGRRLLVRQSFNFPLYRALAQHSCCIQVKASEVDPSPHGKNNW